MKNEFEIKAKEIDQEVKSVEKKQPTVIKTEKDYVKATDFLSVVKKKLKVVEEWRLFFTKPLNDQLKNINAEFKSRTEPLKEIESNVRAEMSRYRREQEERARKEEERLLKLRERREKRAEEKGKPIDPTPVPTVERQDATVQGTQGKSTARKVWKFKVTDETKVPREYLVVDERKIRQAVQRDGVRKIEGVEIYQDYEISVGS